jgi:hypothetical protein
MRSCCRAAACLLASTALLGAGTAWGQVLGPVNGLVPRGRAVFPRATGATPGRGVNRPTSAVFGAGVTRPGGATPGPGVPRAVGPAPGPGVTRPTGAMLGPGVLRPSGAIPGPGVTRSTGATLGPGVTRPSGAVYGPGVTRSTGATPGPNVPRAVGPTPGPNIGRPTGATPSEEGVVRPTGPTFGFTFRPLFQEPFRVGDPIPRDDATRAGRERTDLSTERFELLPAERFDMVVDAPPPVAVFRFDLLPDFPPASDRLDLHTDIPAATDRADLIGDTNVFVPFRSDLSTERAPEPRDERFDMLIDTPSDAVPVGPPVLPGPIVGGSFIGGRVGTLDSEALSEELAEWRLFDAPEYQMARFSTRGRLSRESALEDRSWIVSGYANSAPGWSSFRSEDDGAMRRAGYGPGWSALRR